MKFLRISGPLIFKISNGDKLRSSKGSIHSGPRKGKGKSW